MKIILLLIALMISANASAAIKTITTGHGIDKFVLSETDGGTYDGYVIIVVSEATHRIMYQVSAANHDTELDYCNQVDEDDDPDCNDLDPGPVYAVWDSATQVSGGTLTPANKRKWIWAWQYENYLLPELRALKTWLNASSGYTTVVKRRSMQGAVMQIQGATAVNADACAVIMIVDDGTCNYDDFGVDHIGGRSKMMIEEMEALVITLP